MSKIITLFFFTFSYFIIKAQAPQGINYQAVARNSLGVLLVNQSVGIRISIINDTPTGFVGYMETQITTTNQFGLFSLIIGSGTAITGTFSGITWSTGSKFIKVEVDPSGGTSYIDMGTNKLQSVPFALFSQSSIGTVGPPGPIGSQGRANINGTTNSIIKFIDDTTGGNSQIFNSGSNVGIGTSSPTALLHLKAGSGNPFSASLKIDAGVKTVNPEKGAIENDTTGGTNHLLWTSKTGTRYQLDQQLDTSILTTLSNRINLKVSVADTSSMLASYLRKNSPLALRKDSLATNTEGYSISRKESAPTAPNVELIAISAGRCTPGTHVFAVVFNTTNGHTDLSPISSSVLCDATHSKVKITIPQGIMYEINRDIYASKANTISPLYLISSSPVVSFAIANPDNAESNDYIFNIADSSFTSTVAPTSNTATDNAFSFGKDGQVRFGNGPNSISNSINYLFNGSGSPDVGMFQRFDPGEARLSIINGGVTAPNKYNFPTLMLINPGIMVGSGGSFTYTPLAANSYISTINVMGTYKTDGSFTNTAGIGFNFFTTEAWNNTATGVKLGVTILKTGEASVPYYPLTIESIGGSIFSGATSDSTTYSLQIRKSNNTNLFSVRNDGKIITSNLTASKYNISALNTAPANASDTGVIGEIRITAGFIYICTATNTWVRAALSTW